MVRRSRPAARAGWQTRRAWAFETTRALASGQLRIGAPPSSSRSSTRRGIWSAPSRRCASRSSTAGSRSWSSTAARPTAAAPSSREAARDRRPHSAARQSRRPYAQRAQHRPACRARHVRGPHGRPHALSRATTSREASSGSSSGDVACASGPQLAVGDGPTGRAVALALQSPLGVGGARFRRCGTQEEDVDSGFCGVWRRDLLLELGGWDEDWPVNQDAELAARIRARRRPHRLPAGDGGASTCRARACARSRASTGATGSTGPRPRDVIPAGLRRSHVLPPGLVAIVAGAAVPRPPRTTAAPGCGALRRPRSLAEGQRVARRRASVEARASRDRRAGDDAPVVGRRRSSRAAGASACRGARWPGSRRRQRRGPRRRVRRRAAGRLRRLALSRALGDLRAARARRDRRAARRPLRALLAVPGGGTGRCIRRPRLGRAAPARVAGGRGAGAGLLGRAPAAAIGRGRVRRRCATTARRPRAARPGRSLRSPAPCSTRARCAPSRSTTSTRTSRPTPRSPRGPARGSSGSRTRSPPTPTTSSSIAWDCGGASRMRRSVWASPSTTRASCARGAAGAAPTSTSSTAACMPESLSRVRPRAPRAGEPIRIACVAAMKAVQGPSRAPRRGRPPRSRRPRPSRSSSSATARSATSSNGSARGWASPIASTSSAR